MKPETLGMRSAVKSNSNQAAETHTRTNSSDAAADAPNIRGINPEPSASTDDGAPPSRTPTSSAECPKCRTQLAFDGDECGLCNPEVQP